MMFKVAAVCNNTSPVPLFDSKDGFVDGLLRQISPDDFQHRLEFCLVSGLWLVDPILLQHCSSDVIVKRFEIGRVWRPLIFSDEIWSVLLQPFLRLTSGVSRRTILLKDEGARRYILAVLDQLWQQIGQVILCVEFCFVRYKKTAFPFLFACLLCCSLAFFKFFARTFRTFERIIIFA